MIPTLLVGDLILVNKYHYGIRVPVLHTKLVANNDPKRGDVMVFRYPMNTNLDYIKRVVGVPGDTVAYLNKRLTVNGQAVPVQALPDFYDEDSMRVAQQFQEQLGPVSHGILNDKDAPAYLKHEPASFKFKDHCRYSLDGVVCKVPPGHYFMMGDNRDNSEDSRYWGFVPDENIVGRAFFVWMNFSDLKRIGSFN
jgi:signal peptidase I